MLVVLVVLAQKITSYLYFTSYVVLDTIQLLVFIVLYSLFNLFCSFMVLSFCFMLCYLFESVFFSRSLLLLLYSVITSFLLCRYILTWLYMLQLYHAFILLFHALMLFFLRLYFTNYCIFWQAIS